MRWPTRRERDLLVYGVVYPLVVATVAWIGSGDGSGVGQVLVLVTAVGFLGLLIVFSIVGGPDEVRSSWRETLPEEPARVTSARSCSSP